MPLPIGIPAAAGKLAGILTPEVLDWVKKRALNFMGKPRGSKVKDGAYKDCLIETDPNEEYAFIVVDMSRGEVVMLTSDTIQSCQFLKEDKKLHKGKFKTYYYYNIVFKDGSRSYVRMRRKYRDAMLSHM